jgi:hypothetical protein
MFEPRTLEHEGFAARAARRIFGARESVGMRRIFAGARRESSLQAGAPFFARGELVCGLTRKLTPLLIRS